MAMGACPGQIPMPCVPPALMVTATMVRACRYNILVPIVGQIVELHLTEVYFRLLSFLATFT